MKKLIALVMVIVMLCTTTIMASAATPSAQIPYAPSTFVEDEGLIIKVIPVDDPNATDKLKELYNDITAADSTQSYLDSIDMNIDASDMAFGSVFELYVKNHKFGTPTNVTFDMPGVKEGDKVIVLHKFLSVWSAIPSIALDGKIISTFTGFPQLSPVIILVKSADAKEDIKQSPQTSDINYAGIVVPVVLCAGAVSLLLKKRENA